MKAGLSKHAGPGRPAHLEKEPSTAAIIAGSRLRPRVGKIQIHYAAPFTWGRAVEPFPTLVRWSVGDFSMNATRILFLWFAVTAAATGLQAVNKADLARITPVPSNEPIPAIDFLREPYFQSPQLNRAGTHIAAMISAADSHVQLLVQEIAAQKFEYLIAPDEMDVTSFAWLDDKHIVFTVQYNRMFVGEVGDFKHAYRALEYCSPTLVSVPEANRIRPVIWIRLQGDPNPYGHVITLKADLADTRPVVEDADGVRSIDWRELNEEHIGHQYPRPTGGLPANFYGDKEGELSFCQTFKDGRPALLQLTNDTWTPSPVDAEERRIIAAGNKPGEAVVVVRNPPGTPSAVQFMEVSTGKLGDVLLQDPGYDFDGWLFRDPASHDIVGAVYDRAVPTVVWFNEAFRNLQKTVDAFFPGLVVRIVDVDRAGKKFLLSTWSDRQPVAYYVLDIEKNAVGLIKNSVPWLDPKRMSATSLMPFKTRDGHKLDAYVTIPASASKTNPVPLLVLIDTGLWGRTTAGFNAIAQYFASRGYAVLRPNHRWSAGYAWMFPREDEWALDKMAQDINEATKTVLRTGLIDRSRIAIMGGSLSGTLALSAVVDQPQLYHGAITVQGVFDFAQYIKEQKYNELTNPLYGILVRKLGDPSRDKEKLDQMSPARHGDQIQIPIFISQHREARGESVAQSRSLISTLEAHHIPHELHWVSGIWYGTERLDDSIEIYTGIEAFLAKYMPPGTAAAPTSAK